MERDRGGEKQRELETEMEGGMERERETERNRGKGRAEGDREEPWLSIFPTIKPPRPTPSHHLWLAVRHHLIIESSSQKRLYMSLSSNFGGKKLSSLAPAWNI